MNTQTTVNRNGTNVVLSTIEGGQRQAFCFTAASEQGAQVLIDLVSRCTPHTPLNHPDVINNWPDYYRQMASHFRFLLDRLEYAHKEKESSDYMVSGRVYVNVLNALADSYIKPTPPPPPIPVGHEWLTGILAEIRLKIATLETRLEETHKRPEAGYPGLSKVISELQQKVESLQVTRAINERRLGTNSAPAIADAERIDKALTSLTERVNKIDGEGGYLPRMIDYLRNRLGGWTL